MISYPVLMAVVALLLIYNYLKNKNNLWKRLGIYDLPGIPILGNDSKFVLGLEAHATSQVKKYRQLGGRKYAGTHFIGYPILFVKDPALIERMLVKDFAHFTDRGVTTNEKNDPLHANLLTMAGKKWKQLRNKLTPVFASGKLKSMHDQMLSCADELVEVLNNYADEGRPCDFREQSARFTTDVIGSCAYGIQVNCLNGENTLFREMCNKVFVSSTTDKFSSVLRLLVRSVHPKLVKLLKLKIFSKELDHFFLNLVKDIVDAREKDPKLERNDFIQLLINLKQEDDLTMKESLAPDDIAIDDRLIAANAFLFFLAGYETSSSALSYCLFELSKNPDLQDRLYLDITSAMSCHGGQLTYEAIQSVPLLNAVIYETLRKYPTAPSLLRIVTQPYKLPDSDIVLPVDTRINIPVYSLHNDPAIFPQPHVFDPDRFSPANKENIPKGAYMPFGDGPRACIGIRFAKMELKVALSKIMANFKFEKCASMGKELEFDPMGRIVLQPKGGIWLNFHRRTASSNQQPFASSSELLKKLTLSKSKILNY